MKTGNQQGAALGDLSLFNQEPEMSQANMRLISKGHWQKLGRLLFKRWHAKITLR
jgi:hypothetical protein